MQSVRTLIVIVSIVARGFQPDVAGLALPSGLTLTRPFFSEIDPTCAMVGTLPGTAVQGAVPTVPASHAQARPVLALAVLGATRIARTVLTPGSGPAGLTDALLVLAPDQGQQQEHEHEHTHLPD